MIHQLKSLNYAQPSDPPTAFSTIE